MNAEILSVGTELLLGHTVNTDTAIVARELSTIGVNVLYCATVGDNPGRLKDSGHIEDGTDVVWQAPYARRWYYEDANFQGAPQRGTYWVPRMLQNGGLKQIEDGARKVVKE